MGIEYIVGLAGVLGAVGAMIFYARGRPARRDHTARALAARGAARMPGSSALEVPPTPLLFENVDAPAYSARVPGTRPLFCYGGPNLPHVIAWRAQVAREVMFVIASRTENATGNPGAKLVTDVQRRLHKVKNVELYACSSEAASWAIDTGAVEDFGRQFGLAPAVYLEYVRGVCYLFSSRAGNFVGFDLAEAIADRLDVALRARQVGKSGEIAALSTAN